MTLSVILGVETMAVIRDKAPGSEARYFRERQVHRITCYYVLCVEWLKDVWLL